MLAEKSKINSKLPDLHISKFQGTHLDWVRFWGIFETQIDQSCMKAEAKFSYLKEFVVAKVRTIIDKLPPPPPIVKVMKRLKKFLFEDMETYQR